VMDGMFRMGFSFHKSSYKNLAKAANDSLEMTSPD